MRIFRHTIDIDRPREQVFATFVDWEKAPLWRQYVKTMRPVEPGPIRPGSRVAFTIDLHGDEVAYELTVMAYEPPRLWRHNTNERNFDGHIEYRFDEIPSGTRVTFECVVHPKTMLGWFAMPQMWLSRGQGYREQLPQLKRFMEQGQ